MSTETGSGRIGVAIHPWDIALSLASPPPDEHRNALAGAIGATTLHGGRSRVRVGALLAETGTSPPAAIERGATAYAVFDPAAVRLVPLGLGSGSHDHEEPS